jgi:hypothetical protein
MFLFGTEITPQAMAGFISAFIAGITVVLIWLQWRERKLRQDDVLKWSNDVIRVLQTIYVVCFLGEGAVDGRPAKEMLRELAIDASVLVQQGRLFFKNTPDATYGAERHPAYRGYRPMLLDPIVVAHQVAARWPGAGEEDRLRMTLVAEDCVRRFVSMAQLEVGRGRTAHEDTARKGEGEPVDALLGLIRAERIAALRESPRLSL